MRSSSALQRLSNLNLLPVLSSKNGGRKTSLTKLQHGISQINGRHLTFQQADLHVHSIVRDRKFSSTPSQAVTNSSSMARDQEVFDKTKEILYSTDLGSMQLQQISDAKSLLFIFANRKTFEGSEIAEELLERLVAEGRDGGNRSAQVEAKIYNAVIEGYAKSKTFQGASKAEALLERMMERSEHSRDSNDNGFVAAKPDVVSYNSLMNAWSQSGDEDAVSKAEDLVAFLESDDAPVNPDSVTYNVMMNTYANQVGKYGYAQKAEDILLLMTALQKDGKNSIHPDTLSFNIVLKAWKNSGGGVESAKRAEDILRLMIKLYMDGHYDVKPDKISFQTVVHAYMKHGDNGTLNEDIANHLEGIIHVLLDESGDLSLVRGIVFGTVNKTLEGIRNSGLPDAGDRAKRILDSMVKARDAGKTVDAPDAMAFALVMNAYLSNPSTLHEGRLMMEDWMQGKYPVLPTTYSLNNILHIFCKQEDVGSASDLLQRMTQLASEKGYKTLPDIATFNMMANLYFQSNHKDSAARAFSLLGQLEESFDAKTLKELDPFVYSVVVHKLTQSENPIIREKSFDVLMRMVERYDARQLKKDPETYVYNMVLSSITKRYSAEGAQKALDLLQLMQTRVQEKQSRSLPDILSYSHVLAALSRAMNKDSAKRIVDIVDTIQKEEENGKNAMQIDNIVFETALQGLSDPKYGDKELAHELLQRMFKLAKSGHNRVEPRSLCLNLVLKAQRSDLDVSTDRIVAFDVHRYLMDLVQSYDNGSIKVLPSQVGFNTVLTSWAGARHWKAYRKAEEIYSTMERLSASGAKNVSPDQFTNALMLRIYANSGKKKTAKRAIKFFNKLNNEDLDTFTYNCMLIMLSRSDIDGKVENARSILKVMEKRGLANIASYNTVLNACVYSDNSKKQHILPLALQTYNELIAFGSPNETSFELVVRACSCVSVQDEDVSHLKQIFHDACEKGMLNKKIVSELKRCLPNKKKREEIIGYSLDGDIQKSWQRNTEK